MSRQAIRQRHPDDDHASFATTATDSGTGITAAELRACSRQTVTASRNEVT
jgi:hypothetical protein